VRLRRPRLARAA